MAGKLKVRAKANGDIVTVKVLFKHPMETGFRKDKDSGETIPAHFIKDVTADVNGKNIMTAYWNSSVSKNPYLSFDFKGKKGDKVKVAWKDNKDATQEGEAEVK